VRYEVSGLKQLTEDAARYKYAKLYLKKESLKELEPLILVDMPGFNSPLDQHNKAILTYLERGAYYVVLSSVEDGTVKESLLRHLREIVNFERGFSFFLSKANLRPESTVKELVEYFQKVLEDHLDVTVKVMPVGNMSGKDVVSKLKSIDASALFYSIYKPTLKALCFEIIEAINLRIAAMKQDNEKNKKLVVEMEASIIKIQNKAETLKHEVEERYSSFAINDILNDVGRTLDGAVEELVSVGVTGNQPELTYRLNELVRIALTQSFKDNFESVVEKVSSDFSFELRDLNLMMQDYQAPDLFSQFETNLHSLAANLKSGTENTEPTIQKNGSTSNKGTMLTGVGLVLSLISGGTITVMELVVSSLPMLLAPVFKAFKERKMKEDMRRKFQTEIFPNIRQRLRTELPVITNEALSEIINSKSDEYEEKITLQREQLRQTMETSQNDAEKTEAQIALFESSLAKVKQITEGI
jgi:hypothetical protein